MANEVEDHEEEYVADDVEDQEEEYVADEVEDHEEGYVADEPVVDVGEAGKTLAM